MCDARVLFREKVLSQCSYSTLSLIRGFWGTRFVLPRIREARTREVRKKIIQILLFLIFIRERYLSFEGESTRKDIIFQIQSLSSSSISLDGSLPRF